MQEYHYNFENNTLLKHFIAAFNDITVKRFDGKKKQKESIKVPISYAPKSHILADIIGVTDTIRLPAIAIEIVSEGRDNERIKNKIDDIVYRESDGSYVALRAIPWNMEIQMTIMTKYQEDMEQIIQNFSVHTNPYAIVSWREPKSGREVRTQILWNEKINIKYPAIDNHSPKEPPFRVVATTNFTIKGFLFKTAIDDPKPICFINTDISFTDNFFCRYQTLTAYIENGETESYEITGRPIIRYITPNYIVEGTTPTIKINGFSLLDTIGVFVSGSNTDMYPLTEYQPFTAIGSFMGYKVDEFTKTANLISFTLPAPSANGFVDIVAVNSCGYGKLTEDSLYINGLTSVSAYSL